MSTCTLLLLIDQINTRRSRLVDVPRTDSALPVQPEAGIIWQLRLFCQHQDVLI